MDLNVKNIILFQKDRKTHESETGKQEMLGRFILNQLKMICRC